MTTKREHQSWPTQYPPGWVASYPGNEGWFTGVLCPKCGCDVVYNGNYFCVRWGYACGWALSHDDDDGTPDKADLPTWFAIHETELQRKRHLPLGCHLPHRYWIKH
jgi:hypothetical protein